MTLGKSSSAIESPRPFASLCAVLAVVLACRCQTPDESAPPPADSVVQASRAQAAHAARPFESSASCQLEHSGLFIDLGVPLSQARRSYMLGPFANLRTDTWSDESYTRVSSRQTHYDFWLASETPALEVRIAAQRGSSRRLTVSIDNWRLGAVTLDGAGFHTVRLPALKMRLSPGRHQLNLQWSGRRAPDQPYGMLEWIHIGRPGQFQDQYRPPLQRSLLRDVVLGDVPKPSVVLEAPGSLACPLQALSGSKLQLSLGYLGQGTGVARIIAHRDGQPPVQLLERRVEAGEAATWAHHSIDLSALAPHLIRLELSGTSDGEGQLVFGDPRVVAAKPPGVPPRAPLAVVVIASGLHRELLPPFASSRGLRHLTELSRASTYFAGYRAPTTLAGGAVASLLSGRPPLAHGLWTEKAKLGASVELLADRLREQSGESAMFTGVPSTRSAFGFSRGWNAFEQYSPVNDIPATEPLQRARLWLESQLGLETDVQRLAFVHLRGAHPPWDLSQDEVASLEPREYHGLIEARRGGIILRDIRARHRLSQRRLSTPDWVRLRALQRAALEKQDNQLGQLIASLQKAGVWDSTLFVFGGDVAAGDPPVAPFGDGRPPTEDRLITPLWIKFPGGVHAGRVVEELVTSVDVARTVADTLGLTLEGDFERVHLLALANGESPPLGRPLLAMVDQDYATRWGRWLLIGSSPKAPRLCELNVDPTCANDVSAENPLATETLWRQTFVQHQHLRGGASAAATTERSILDKDTAAALRVWGD